MRNSVTHGSPSTCAAAYRDGICTAVATSAIVTLSGWFTGHRELVTLWLWSSETMKCNTAAVLIACCVAFLFRNRAPRLSISFGMIAAFIGGVTLMEYAGSIDLGIDTILCHANIEGSHRMAPQTALASLALGLACIGLAYEHDSVRIFTIPLAAVAQMMAILGAIGYLMGVSQVYKIGSLSGMAPSTLVGVTLLCWCIQDEVKREFRKEAKMAHLMLTGAMLGGALVAWLIAIQKVV